MRTRNVQHTNREMTRTERPKSRLAKAAVFAFMLAASCVKPPLANVESPWTFTQQSCMAQNKKVKPGDTVYRDSFANYWGINGQMEVKVKDITAEGVTFSIRANSLSMAAGFHNAVVVKEVEYGDAHNVFNGMLPMPPDYRHASNETQTAFMFQQDVSPNNKLAASYFEFASLKVDKGPAGEAVVTVSKQQMSQDAKGSDEICMRLVADSEGNDSAAKVNASDVNFPPMFDVPRVAPVAHVPAVAHPAPVAKPPPVQKAPSVSKPAPLAEPPRVQKTPRIPETK